MSEDNKVDYSEFYYGKDKTKRAPHRAKTVKQYADNGNIVQSASTPPICYTRSKSKKSNAIAVLLIILCFSATLFLCDYFSNGYLLADFDSVAASSESDYYAIQTGMYSDRKTAEFYAAIVRERGGGGYVLFDKYYRVLVSVYEEKDKAETVVERLSRGGTEASIYTFNISPYSDNSISAADRAILADASTFTYYCYNELYILSNALDSETLTGAELAARLTAMKAYLLGKQKAVEAVEFSTAALALSSALSATHDIIDDLPSAPLSSDLRYTYLAVLAQRL